MVRPPDLLERMRQHRVGWRFGEVERILRYYDFEFKNQNGSDRVYRHELSGVRYFVSHHGAGPVKPGYIKRLTQKIDESRKGL
jgi:predicted RNA binding protein YcfA (HicA-like mRNA interferase family)